MEKILQQPFTQTIAKPINKYTSKDHKTQISKTSKECYMFRGSPISQETAPHQLAVSKKPRAQSHCGRHREVDGAPPLNSNNVEEIVRSSNLLTFTSLGDCHSPPVIHKG